MIDFSTLHGLAIPEGVVTQITDPTGRVIWAVQNNKPVVLQVEKITSDTYAGETLYEGEQFILLDIYPKNKNSCVVVTYGGVEQQITFHGTNAEQVYFGTFNNDSRYETNVASGELTITGDYSAFGCGSFANSNKAYSVRCNCIRTVVDWGAVEKLPDFALEGNSMTELVIPNTIQNIGTNAFVDSDEMTSIIFPDGLSIINSYVCYSCDTLKYIELPKSITAIKSFAFSAINFHFGTIRILAKTAPVLEDDAIPSAQYDYTIIVPKGCGETYKTAEGWSNYADHIVEAS